MGKRASAIRSIVVASAAITAFLFSSFTASARPSKKQLRKENESLRAEVARLQNDVAREAERNRRLSSDLLTEQRLRKGLQDQVDTLLRELKDSRKMFQGLIAERKSEAKREGSYRRDIEEKHAACSEELAYLRSSEKGEIVKRCEIEKRLSFEQGLQEMVRSIRIKGGLQTENCGFFCERKYCSVSVRYRGTPLQQWRMETNSSESMTLADVLSIAGGVISLIPRKVEYRYSAIEPSERAQKDHGASNIMFAVNKRSN